MQRQRSSTRTCQRCGAAYRVKNSRDANGRGRFCSLACCTAQRRDDSRATFLSRFWERVQHGDGCWEWTGNHTSDGYGTMHVGGRRLRAHRVSWEIAHGPILGDLLVLHACDNRRCVRPDHLFLGTDGDNMHDMLGKGRNRRIGKKGAAHHNVRLDEAAVRLIRQRYDNGGVTQSELAAAYGVGQTTISKIVRGARWRHLQ